MGFFNTLICVGTMVLYALPGYLFVRTKMIGKESISAFSKVLMYFCQPFLTIYSFTQATYTWDLFVDMLWLLLASVVLQGAILILFYFLFRRKYTDVRYRVATVATCFGNCGFIGMPLLQALLPDHPEAVAFSAVFFMGMNLLGWTVASAIITQDKKYISLKKVFLNPATLALVVALPLFFTNAELPTQLESIVSVLAKMTTPLCMLIMGMRLATMPLKNLVNDPLQYGIIAIKQLAMPLCALLLISVCPVEPYVKQTMFILSACPVAAVVQNFAELLGQGQETAADLVLLGTGLSVLTIPVMMLLI